MNTKTENDYKRLNKVLLKTDLTVYLPLFQNFQLTEF